jgi:hypothetical protein
VGGDEGGIEVNIDDKQGFKSVGTFGKDKYI